MLYIIILYIYIYIYICMYENIFSKRKSFISDHILHTHLCAVMCIHAQRLCVCTCIVERKRT